METDDLEVDHITPETKSFSIMSKWSLGLEKLKPELEKCQLLCNVCHKNKSDEALRVPHGGGVSGKKNCKCIPCRAQKNKYMREWKSRKHRV